MKFASTENSIDGFRFINHLHTTARQLYICSEIVSMIGSKQLPVAILKQMLTEWSKQEEIKNEQYKNDKGKLTDNGKATTALQHYLNLCNELGLIINLNNFYSTSRLGYLLVYFISQSKVNRETINHYEKLFYLFQLINVDADGILLVMNLLENEDKNQLELQQNFKDNFNKRLAAKKEIAPQTVKEVISEKYRAVNFLWKKPEKYSEHILIPRCEWLKDLSLLEIVKKGSSSIYSLTTKGKLFYKNIPSLENDFSTRDVNEYWLFNRTFNVLDKIVQSHLPRRLFQELPSEERKNILGNSLNNALAIIKTSTPFKISLFDSLLFITFTLFIEKNIVTEFSNIIEEIEKGIIYDDRQFLLIDEGRINESYITTRISE